MSANMDLVEVHPGGEVNWCFRFGCGGGRIGVEACGERLTPYGGLAAWSHYVEHLGIVEGLASRWPVERANPNATPVGDILHGFINNALMGGRRFAHIRRMQDDRAAAAILGLKRGRVCGEDAFVRMMSQADRLTLPSSRIFTRNASKNTTGYIRSSGRFCHDDRLHNRYGLIRFPVQTRWQCL